MQHATQMKDLKDMYQTERNVINVRQAVATGHVAGTQALDKKEMPVMKFQIAKPCDKHTKAENPSTDADRERVQYRKQR